MIIGLYPGSKSRKVAEEKGFKVYDTGEAVKKADIIFIAVPDTRIPEVYEADVAPNLSKGKTLLFSHGFAIHFKTIVPPKDVDVIMVAPKGPGHIVRRQYTEGKAFRRSSPSIKTQARRRRRPRSHGRMASAARAVASSRRVSRKRPKPICLGSKPCFAAAPRL